MNIPTPEELAEMPSQVIYEHFAAFQGEIIKLQAQLLLVTGERDGERKRWSEPAKRWRRMRKAVADLRQGCMVSDREAKDALNAALGAIDTVAGDAPADTQEER